MVLQSLDLAFERGGEWHSGFVQRWPVNQSRRLRAYVFEGKRGIRSLHMPLLVYLQHACAALRHRLNDIRNCDLLNTCTLTTACCEVHSDSFNRQ